MNQAPRATATVMAAFDNPQQILASLGSIEGLHLLERGMSRLERSASGFGGRAGRRRKVVPCCVPQTDPTGQSGGSL